MFVIGNGERTTIDMANTSHCYCTVETRFENDGLDEYIGAYSDDSRAVYVFDEENKTLIGSLSDFPGTELNKYLVSIVDVNHSSLTTTPLATFPREKK